MSATKTDMPYVRLGRSGLKVSKIILGCMSYGTKDWAGWVVEEEEAIKQIKAAYAAGINTFDTANAYSGGESERILGKAIKAIGAPRESFVILTKVFFPSVPGRAVGSNAPLPPNRQGLSRKHIFDSIKASLERLQLDYVDVLQCHRFDPETPIEETMHALHDIVKAGYVRYIGMSSCWAWQFHIMQNYAITNNLTPFISMQNYYSLVYREEEREMVPLCKHLGVGMIPWSPLSGGVLTRPRKDRETTLRGQVDPFGSLHAKDASAETIDRVEELAKKKGVSMAQIGLAWVMSKDPVAAPIVGTTNLAHLEDMIKSVHVKLTEEEIRHLEEHYSSRSIVGHQ